MDFLDELKKNINEDDNNDYLNEMLNDVTSDSESSDSESSDSVSPKPVLKIVKIEDDIFEQDKPKFNNNDDSIFKPKLRRRRIMKERKEISMSKDELNIFANSIIDKYKEREDFKKRLLIKEEQKIKEEKSKLIMIQNKNNNRRRNFFDLGHNK